MNPSLDASARRHWAWFLVPLVLLRFAACCRERRAPNEPRYAMVAKWMLDHDEYLAMRRCGGLYSDKPPLVSWMSDGFGWLSS